MRGRAIRASSLVALVALAGGCRAIWGFEEPTPTGTGGAGGTGGTGAGGGTGGDGGGGNVGGTGGGGGCMSPDECPAPAPCFLTTCTQGVCGVEPLPAGSPAESQTKGDCKTAICDGDGGSVNQIDEADPFDDAKECTEDKCIGSTPKNDPVTTGTTCATGKCSDAGECVECVEPADCASAVCGADGACLLATCGDGTVNAEETDVDCGGSECAACGVGQKCSAGSDCVSGVCSAASLCACSQPACPVWTKAAGAVGEQSIGGIATDATGNVYVVGEFMNAVDFGSGLIPSVGGTDIFVAKYDPQGALLWLKTYGDAGLQGANGVAVDATGNAFVVGYMAGSVDFGGGPIASGGGSDVFVLKLDPNGAFQWSERFGDGAGQNGLAIAVDGSGNAAITGSFAGSIDFGLGPLVGAGNADVFVAKLSPAGTPLFHAKFGAGNDQFGYAVAADSADNVFVAGSFTGTMTVGMTDLQNAGGHDAFVVKLSPAGTVLWAKGYGDSTFQSVRGIAVDKQGGPVIVGSFQGSVDFGSGKPLVATGLHDAFAVKLNSLGNHLWSNQYGSDELQEARAVAVDEDDNVILTGAFYGAIDFGGGAMTSAGVQDLFLAKLDPAGEFVWSLRAGDDSNQIGVDVAVDPLGNILVGGKFQGTIDFGVGPITSAGASDLVLAKLGP